MERGGQAFLERAEAWWDRWKEALQGFEQGGKRPFPAPCTVGLGHVGL